MAREREGNSFPVYLSGGETGRQTLSSTVESASQVDESSGSQEEETWARQGTALGDLSEEHAKDGKEVRASVQGHREVQTG